MTEQATFEAFARQYAKRGMNHSVLQIPVVLEFALACWIEATRLERERCAKVIEPKNDPSDWTECAEHAALLARIIRENLE